MANYKITNITKSLDKRNPNYNSIVTIEYPENMLKKNVTINPDNQIVMVLSSLPQSITHLRMNKAIMVEEINEFQVNKLMDKQKPLEIPVETGAEIYAEAVIEVPIEKHSSKKSI